MTQTAHIDQPTTSFPRIVDVGLNGILINFSDQLTQATNQAALAFRSHLEGLKLPGVIETTTSMTSAFVVYDPLTLPKADLRTHLLKALNTLDWTKAELPINRKLWRIPAVFDETHGPQLAEAAELAGVSVENAIRDLCDRPLRVLTLGFAPGQPYLGSLAEHWNIPRQTGLTKQVPIGAITVAIRQIVLFATSSPTGWRQVGQSGFRGYRPEREDCFALTPGDEVVFHAVSSEKFVEIQANDPQNDGGATWEPLS